MSRRWIHAWRAGLATLALLPATASAHDHDNLEEGLPVEIADAYPLDYLAREVQARVQYRYTPEGEHEGHIEPRLELGFPYNTQLTAKLPVIVRSTSQDPSVDLGRAALEVLYNFNQETLSIPALALAGGLEAPDTRDGGSFDPFFKLLLTKRIPGTIAWHRLHLNGSIQPNVDPDGDERDFRYHVAAGYDIRVAATVIGVIDAVRDQPMKEGPAENYGEIGVRIQVTPLAVVALGGGAGATDDGDVVARGTAAFQWFAF